jgi:hypothetical protein
VDSHCHWQLECSWSLPFTLVDLVRGKKEPADGAGRFFYRVTCCK